jgi:16S rRNA (cytosine1402-N4)-methyltransferase
MRHIPVLLKEILDGLELKKGFVFVDCNLGDGGHSQAVIEALEGDVTVVGFDLDQNAIDRAKANISESKVAKKGKFDSRTRLHLFRKNFRTLKGTFESLKADKKSKINEADAILFDLGISSYEIDESGRGFSFKKEEPLKMTFGEKGDHPFTAYDIVNTWDEENIADIIYAYGEDKFARRIANAIVEAREKLMFADATSKKSKPGKGIETTTQLAEIVTKAVPGFARHGKIHPATRTFQALRITVNDELRALTDALPQAMDILKSGGKLAVISFHSLEDRIVKRFFNFMKTEGKAEVVTKRPLTPSEIEVAGNPRSRSSKLRILKKV